MKTAHAIFGAVVAAFGVAAFVTFYDDFKPGTQMPPDPNAAAQKSNSLTPANSIAHDFAVLPTPASTIAQELAYVPKSVHTVPPGTQTPPHPNAAAQKADSFYAGELDRARLCCASHTGEFDRAGACRRAEVRSDGSRRTRIDTTIRAGGADASRRAHAGAARGSCHRSSGRS